MFSLKTKMKKNYQTARNAASKMKFDFIFHNYMIDLLILICTLFTPIILFVFYHAIEFIVTSTIKCSL